MSSGDVPPPSIASAPYQGIPPAAPPSSKKIFWILGTIVLGFFLLVVLIVGAIVATVFSAIRSSEPYKHAVTVAVQASRVQAALGAPIKQGLIGGGSIDVAGDTGNADLSIPIAGAHHKGTLYVVARKSEGEWIYQTLAVRVADGGERIDLLRPPGRILLEKR